ncbi:hypothetical protein FB451DRAFT_1219120 [Mycena latifolia]|nr:hypothetical protein FB451DRAFT_1219120 [Mycena latifolia]
MNTPGRRQLQESQSSTLAASLSTQASSLSTPPSSMVSPSSLASSSASSSSASSSVASSSVTISSSSSAESSTTSNSASSSSSTSVTQSSSLDTSRSTLSTTTTSSSPPPITTKTTTTSSSTAPSPTSSLETLRSTIFVTTTDSLGHTTTSAPIAITSVVTFTSNGVPETTTVVKLNPTLGSDGHSSGGSSFFKNTGAVAGVFVLVGLAAASIVLWILFGLRRRRRNRRIEHDTAVSATLAAAGFHRAPLDDDEHHDSRHSRALASSDMEMRTGSALALGTKSSLPSARTSGYQDSPGHDDVLHDGFNPYQEYDAAGPREGYIPARTQSPPPTAFVEPYRDASGSGPDHVIGHSASHSVGSTEPLLASFNRASPASPAPSRPTKNPKREADRRSQIAAAAPPSPRLENRRRSTSSSVYSSESTGDERLNPALRNGDIQDSEDYSRVLGVRNIPDGVSNSGES